MEQFTCSLCGGTDSRGCFSAYDFDQSSESYEIVRCKSCGLALTTPMPDPATMDRYYPETYYGSGRANLLRFLKELGCNCYGTERSKFPADSQLAGIKVFIGSVAEGDYEDEFFDAVVIWHVFEHLHEPVRTLDEIARITRKEGIIAIAVPNFSSLQSTWFKSDWFHLDLPRHLYHFNVKNLCKLLREKGYSIDSASTCSLEQNIFGFVQSFMNKLKFIGKPNEFYSLIQKRSGFRQTLKFILWLIIAVLILPLAMIEFVVSCMLGRGACAIVFAHKT